MNAICQLTRQFGPVIGRILIALLFIPAGIHKITGFEGTAGYMASKGLPLAEVLLVFTILVELGGGLMILLGWRAREAALILALFLIPVTVVFHGYWNIEDAAQQSAQQIAFYKNLAILGGALFIAAFGPGSYSLMKQDSSELSQ